MNMNAELRGFWHLFLDRRRHAVLTNDRLGFGYSRADSAPVQPVPVPDGVDLYFFTGRADREATR